MGQSKQVKEFRNFTGGLVTDGPLLSRADNTTTDEANFRINKDGSRSRRDVLYKDNSSADSYTASQGYDATVDVAITTFVWEAAGGIPGNDRVVVQVGTEVFLSAQSDSIPERNHITFPSITSNYTIPMSFATMSGKLIIATGQGEPYLVSLSAADVITVEQIAIRVRDSFGEADTGSAFSGEFSPLDDLLSEGFLDERPTTMTRSHEYNLRNQGWGTKRTSYTTGRTEYDPIRLFNTDSGVYPSNADSVVPWLKTNPNAGANSFRIRFDSESLESNTPTNSRAPYGSFVINLLSRGQSRATELERVNTKQGFTTFAGSISTDLSSGGPRLVEEFAGRVWYAGFSDEVTGGTDHSPTLSSILAYSQSVEKDSQIGKCFQEGDPTHEDQPDLVDTDGGFIKIAGVSDVVKLVAVDDSLVVFARNGTWAISGGESLFTANNQLVYKVSDDAIVQEGSTVKVGNTVYFMSDLAIHKIGRDQSGRLSCIKISDKVSTLLSDWQPSTFSNLSGVYDEFENVIKWVFGNNLRNAGEAQEIVYNLNFDAFSFNTYPGAVDPANGNSVVGYVEVPSTDINSFLEVVTDGGVTVTDSGADVESSVSSVSRAPVRHRYLCTVGDTVSTTSLQTFGTTTNRDGFVGDYSDVDYEMQSYIKTPPLTLPESSRRKSCPYAVFHLGFFEGPEVSVGSSCLVTPRWGFDEKFGKTFEAYKTTDLLFPGTIISSRRKIRGRGRELSFLMEADPTLPLVIYGWGMDIDTNKKL